jgi:hypothetical protein
MGALLHLIAPVRQKEATLESWLALLPNVVTSVAFFRNIVLFLIGFLEVARANELNSLHNHR